MVCSRRQADEVHLVKIHGLERDCALALAKKARRAALTYKSGYTCHVCGYVFERRGLLVEHKAQHPPDVVPTVGERPKRTREEDTAEDGNTLKCPWCAKKCAAHAWLRKHMIRGTQRSSYRQETQRLRTHLLVTARQGRRNRSSRNLYASNAIASSRARRGSQGTSVKQSLS
ncbi:hypothetical protein TRVL_09684 [Trypanosoma vivax]|nr:hypothetical protein TRVL_09684 [Trypanosoma vivax]